MSENFRKHAQSETITGRLLGLQEEEASRSRPCVSILILHEQGESVDRLSPGQALVVGRGDTSDLCIPDRSLSRKHARFSFIEGRIFVEDLGAKNGVWLRKQRVERAEIGIGDEVMLGPTVSARVIAHGAPLPTTLEGEGSFRRRLSEEIERSRHFRRPLAVLAVRASTLAVAQAPSTAWVKGVVQKLGPVHQVCLYPLDTALALLPETDPQGALKVARRIAASPATGAPFLVGVAVYPESATTAEKLIELARGEARTADRESRVRMSSTSPWAEGMASLGEGRMVVGAAMREVLAQAEQVASANVPTLLLGETGVGKEVLADFIHSRSRRSDKPILRVNCGAIAASLVESELLGHEKNAFTGAQQRKVGVFEAAHEGTLFLDEIGDLPLPAQATLLRVLSEKRFCRVGSTQEIEVDVRILAATHRDLEAMVAQGQFREDLYYRLNTVILRIPPLRERRDELRELATRFLEEANKAHLRSVQGFSDDAMALLLAYPWPGNIRQLRGAVERAVVFARGLIEPKDLPAHLSSIEKDGIEARSQRPSAVEAIASGDPVAKRSIKDELGRQEAQAVEDALRKTGWRPGEAARRLGIHERTLRRKILKFGLKPPR